MTQTPADQQEIFSAYRPLLFSIAYRMLGSVMDAEDCVQEVFLQWQEALAKGPASPVEKPKAYLCTLVTRRCIDHLRSARVQRESYAGLWLPEPLVATDPAEFFEFAESLSMAFMLLLERLAPLERAIFLLRQVFDYDYAEIAAMVGRSATTCRQVMHRARQHLALPHSQARMVQEEQQQIFAQFLQACQSGDMDGLLQVLSADIVLHTDSGGKVSAARNPVVGPSSVARYLLGIQRKFLRLADLAIYPVQINGQPGLLGYLSSDEFLQKMLWALDAEQRTETGRVGARETTRRDIAFYRQIIRQKGQPLFALALTLAERQIQEIDILVNPDKLRHIPAFSA